MTEYRVQSTEGVLVSGFRFQVSRAHPLCPSKIGGRAKRRGYASLLPILLSPLTVVFLQTPPSLRATSPNLEEESGRMTNGNVKTEM